MPSQFDQDAADEWDRCFTEFQQTVIQRVGGRSDRTQDVVGSVDFDEKISQKIAIDLGGLIDGDRGQYIDVIGLLDVPADQETMPEDTWVIDGEVYKTHGEPIGTDGGCKSIIIHRRINKRARGPRVTRR